MKRWVEVLGLFLGMGMPAWAGAQSTEWAAQLVVPAYPSPYLSEWERNPQNLTLSVAYFGAPAMEYRIEGVVRGSGGELARATSPVFTVTGGPANELYSGADLLGWDVRVRQDRADQVLGAGVLPEDDYELCARVLSEAGIQLTEACTLFAVALPAAPQLLYPLERQAVSAFQPVFQWTPVQLPPEVGTRYRVSIVPMAPRQTAGTAVRANLPVYEDVVDAPVLVYPVDALELEDGVRYAWRVEALDGLGDAVVPGGLFSETWTFTASTARTSVPWDEGEGRLPSAIDLVPGLAEILDLGALDVETTASGWRLNGPAWMRLGGPFNLRARVRLDDLEVDVFAGSHAVRGGGVVARLAAPLPVAGALPVRVTELTYDAAMGLTAQAVLVRADGTEMPLEGDVQVTAAGLFGTLRTGEAGGQDPVWRLGTDPVELSLTDLEVRLPGGTVTARGDARLLGGMVECRGMAAALDEDGVWTVTPMCMGVGDYGLEVVDGAPGSSRATAGGAGPGVPVRVGLVAGTLSANLVQGTVAYDLTASAALDLDPGAADCSIRFDVALDSTTGTTVDGVTGPCDATRAALDAGWVRLGLGGLRVASVSYTPGQGFEIEADVDLVPTLPALPDLELPTLTGARVGGEGLTFPDGLLPGLQASVDLDGYGLAAASVTVPAGTIPWAAWRDGSLEGFGVTFDAALALPGLPATTPLCLAEAVPAVRRGIIAAGLLTLDVTASTAFREACRIPLAPDAVPGLALEAEAFVGPVVTDLSDGVTLVDGLGVTGSLILPEVFSCQGASLRLDGALRLAPDGRLAGESAVSEGGCDLSVGGLDLDLASGEVDFELTSDGARGRWTAEVAVRTVDGEVDSPTVDALGRLTFDVATGAIADGVLEVPGPLDLRLPQEDPVFDFRLDGARLDAAGLTIDGRHALRFPDGATMGVTFDEVRVAPEGRSFTAGRVLFDTEFALDGGVAEDGRVAWRAVSTEMPFTLASGFRVGLPAQVALTPSGLEVAGEGAARVVYAGEDVTELSGSFEDGFVLGLDPLTVAGGYLDLLLQGRRLAYVDDTGFHPDFGALAVDLVPARLPLPSLSVAYLQLRDEDGTLLLAEEELEDGVRIYTPEGTTVPLVLPALALERSGGGAPGAGAPAGPAASGIPAEGDPPTVDVTVDLVVGRGFGPEVRSGVVTGLVDPVEHPELDLSASGLPFRVRTATFADPDGAGMRWRLEGDPVLFGSPVEQGSSALELTADSRLLGEVDLPYAASLPLVPDSDVLVFQHQRVVGAFDVSLPDGGGAWSMSLEGDLALDLDGSGGLAVAATLELDPWGARFTELDVMAEAPPVYFDGGLLELGVSGLRLPDLGWTPGDGWDFEAVFDATLRFPGLDGVTTGLIPDLRLTPGGLAFPSLELADLSGGFDLAGFRIAPRALRLPAVDLDVFGSGLAFDWAPSFDLSIELGGDGTDRWPALAGFTFSALDVTLGLDGFTGGLEPLTLLNPFALELGSGGLGVSLGSFSGAFTVGDGGAGLDLVAGGALLLPEALRCETDPAAEVTLPDASLQLFGNGGMGGRFDDVAVSCPLRMGPLELELTDADLVFAFVDDVQQVNLFTDAVLTLEGVTGGGGAGGAGGPGGETTGTVTATGSLDLSLLEPRVRGGQIVVDQPFSWGLPTDDPFVTFTVSYAELDGRGFVLDGSGAVVGAAGAVGPDVVFDDLTFDHRGELVAGSATVDAGLVLDASVYGSALAWTVAEPGADRTEGDGFRLALGAAATLGADGLALNGSATGSLHFADSTYAALDVSFSDGFTLTPRAPRVNAGRADFALDGTQVAFVDRRGFFPGDVFGVLPLPERIGLPTEDVAYLQVRDPDTGTSLVTSAVVTDGVQIATRPNAPVSLVLPGVPAPTGGPTVLPVTFDVVMNGGSYALASGSLEVAAADGEALFDLSGLGVPLEVVRVAYDPAEAPGPVLDARVRLPESWGGADVRFQGLTVTAQGLEGEVVAGTFAAAEAGGAPIGSAVDPGAGMPLADVGLGALDLTVDGARVRFGASPDVTLQGGIRSELFEDADGTRPRLGYSASVDPAGALTLLADVSTLPNGRLPLGVGTFEPVPLGSQPAVTAEASAESFALILSGVLRMPDLSETFALTVQGLRVGTDGIGLPSVSLTGAEGAQELEIFGGAVTLRDTDAGPGLGLGLDGRVLLLTLNGDLDLLGRTVAFEGLRVGTDGRLEMAGASLLGDPVALVPGAITLTALAVRNRALEAGLAIDLPAPFDGVGTQTATFAVAADGTVSGGGRITLLDEPQGLGGERTQFGGSFATAHLRYLGVRLAPGTSSPGAVEAVGDVYLAGEAANRIELGRRSGAAVEPGLSIGFDGDVAWGGVTLARSFTFDHDMFRLTVAQVTATPSDGGLGLGLGGSLVVDVPSVTGGIDFTGFGVSPDLALSTDDASVNGGTLTIAGILSLGLSDFVYSDEPTTISGVQGGAVPTGGQAAAAATATDIEVASVLSFGGTVSVGSGCGEGGDCLFSGGVERFLFYRTPVEEGGLTHLVVRGANLSVANALSMEADLTYRQVGTSGGFELTVGGRADFQAMEVTVVGALERGGDADALRAGLFLIASGRMEIVPAVLALTEVGGGFFYNPRPEYCQLVRTYSGVADLSSNGSSCENSGRFTGFLFAGAELIERNIGRGQVLLTVSERGLQLDGQMALLSPGSQPIPETRIRGTVHLAVGFQEFFAEGNIDLVIDYDPLLTVGGPDDPTRLGFYVYGPDAWGVYGGLSIEFLRLIQGNAEFFVGPPGFFVQGHIHAGFDFWIVSVEGTADAAVWVVDDGWGAYLDVGITAEILGGAVSGSARLRGALVSPPQAPVLLYASAIARGCVLGLCGSEEIWASFEGGSVSGGFGRNAKFDRVIGEMERVRNRFEAERVALQEKIESAQLFAGMALSPTELAEIYARIQDEGLRGRFLALVQEERAAYPDEIIQAFGNFDATAWWRSERDHYLWYTDVVSQVGSPDDTQTPAIDSYYQAVSTGVQNLENHRSIVELKLSQAMVEIETLEAAVDRDEIGANPLRSASFTAPQTLDNGDGTRTLVSGPTVDFDAAAASEMENELRALRTAHEAYAREVARRIEQVEAGLGWIDYLLLDTTSTAPLGFVRDYASVLQAVSEQYARHGDLLLRQQDWYRARSAELAAQLSMQVIPALHRKSQLLMLNGSDPQGQLEALIDIRTAALDDLREASNLSGTFDANVQNAEAAPTLEQYKAVADTLGKYLWYDIAHYGMQVADTLAGQAFAEVRARADGELRDRWREHADMTMDLHRAMEARADIMAGLYELYQEFGRGYPQQPTIQRVTSFDGTGNPFMQDALARAELLQSAIAVHMRVEALEEQFQVPTVNHVAVVSQNLGYMARETYWWEASHPRGVHEYLYNSVPGGNVGVLGVLGMQSNGAVNVRENYILTPGRGTTTQDRTLRVAARGGAGYVGYGRASYQTRFEGGDGVQPVGQGQGWGATVDASPPTAPTVRIGAHASTTRPRWVASTSQIDSVRWSALDLESGIGGYAYAVGTDTDTTAVRGWTDVGGRSTMVLRELELSTTGPEYRIWARARNGEGLTGPAGRSAPIRVDVVPPTFPDTASIGVPIHALVASPFTFLTLGGSGQPSDPVLAAAAPACAPPSLRGSLVSGTTSPSEIPAPATPAMTFRLPRAEDAESGVAGYAWRVGTEPALSYQGAGWTYVSGTPDTLRVSGAPLNYQDPFYFSLVAVDAVGHTTEPLHYGPFLVADPTAPVAPTFCVGTGNAPDRLVLSVRDPGSDPETGLASWDFRIRREDGSVVRDWPAAPDRESLASGDAVGTGALPLQDGDRVYAELRARNGRGGVAVAASGPLTIDLTPPAAPVIRGATARRSGSYTIVTVDHRTDAEAGLTHHWTLVPESGRVTQGTLPGTGGAFLVRDIPMQTRVGTSLVPGPYTLVLVSRTATGLTSAEATVPVVVP